MVPNTLREAMWPRRCNELIKMLMWAFSLQLCFATHAAEKSSDGGSDDGIDELSMLQVSRPSERMQGNFGFASVPQVSFGQLSACSSHVLVILSVCLAIPSVLMVLIMMGSPLPQPNVGKGSQQPVYPPKQVLLFTGLICIGVMANVTVVIPSATHVASVATQSAAFSGVLIGQYSIGALVGLIFFAHLSIERLWGAYMAYACITVVGNAAWAFGAVVEGPVLLCIARATVGLGGGCMYNSALSMVHFAKGPAYTACLVLYQFFVAAGVLTGPVVASVSSTIGRQLGLPLQDVLASLMMSLWGAALLVALWAIPPPESGTCHGDIRSGAPTGEEITSNQAEHNQPSAANGLAMHNKSGLLSSGLTLIFLFVYSAILRMTQRLLFESGIIFILEEVYHWSAASAGLCMGVVGTCTAIAQVIFSYTIAGRYEDISLMAILEATQLIGILMMIHSSKRSLLELLVGGTIAYSANAIWGGVNAAFCMKRSTEGLVASPKTMLVCNQIAIFTGIALGSMSSRYLLSSVPHPTALAVCMIAPCLLQMVMTIRLLLA